MLDEETNITPARLSRCQEDELVTLAQLGNRDAFELLYERYHKSILNFIYRFIGNAEDAQELCQDTFLKACVSLPRVRTETPLRFGAWLYRIATNRCLDEVRHRQVVHWQPWDAYLSVFHPSQVARDNPERDCLAMELSADVQHIMAGLHPKQGRALLLREYGDRSYDEIAAELQTTRNAVKSLLFRAREDFRRRWTAQEWTRGQRYAEYES